MGLTVRLGSRGLASAKGENLVIWVGDRRDLSAERPRADDAC